MLNKFSGRQAKGQVAIFVIIAIVIVVSIAIFFALRGNFIGSSVPKELQPVYSYFEGCMQDNLNGAVNLMETQGGYIYVPEFKSGNDNFPSSSQMDFFGFPVPYWMYVSASGIKKEQMPSKSEMESQISRYIEEGISRCDFSKFFSQGFKISVGDISASTAINTLTTKASLSVPLTVAFGEVTAEKSDFEVSLDTKLGQFYDTASSIYQKESSEKFLENYGVDILRLYAPVDGVELSCSPKIWNPQDVVSTLLNATEANIAAIKFSGNKDYKLTDKENKYFVVSSDNKDNVRFVYSSNFPTKVEIWPVENNIMRADPVGQEAGMGIIGFCYVPYHFVYDFVFPVMIQVYEGDEIFQFPVVVDISKNQANPQSVSEAVPTAGVQLCGYKNSPLTVYTYNNKLEPVSANISFKCFTTECEIGESKIVNGEAVLQDNFPTCVNGFVIAKAGGYATAREQVSTNEESNVNILLDREYTLNLNMSIGNALAIVNFISEKNSITAVYPEQKTVTLSEGDYNISVYVYRNSTITIPASNDKKCVQIPKSGLGGFLGGTEEQCYDLSVPSQTITFALAGGGTQSYYLIESALENAKSIIINPTMFSAPKSLEELQSNYIKAEASGLGVELV